MIYNIDKFKLNINNQKQYLIQIKGINKNIEVVSFISFEVQQKERRLKVDYYVGNTVANSFIFYNIPLDHLINISEQNYILIQEIFSVKKKNIVSYEKEPENFHYSVVNKLAL